MFQHANVVYRSLLSRHMCQFPTIAQLKGKKSDNILEQSFSEKWLKAKPTSEIPGPSVFNMIRGFMPGGEYYKMSFDEFALAGRKKYGDIFMIPAMFGKPSMLQCFNAHDFSTFMHAEGAVPMRRGLELMNYHRTVHRKDDYGDVIGLLGSNGEAWSKIRTAVNPILMKPQNILLYLEKLQEVSSEFLERIREIRNPDSMEVPGNFFDEINRLAFESVAVIALDQQLGLIRKHRDSQDAKMVFESIHTIIDLTIDMEIHPSLWRIISTSKFRRMITSYETMHDFIMKLINEALERIEKQNSISNERVGEKSVLEKLLKIDKKVAVVMAFDLLMAGVYTTSNTFTGILFSLAKHPEKQAKLREEVRSVLPQKDSLLTVDTIRHLPYLKACLKESIRMNPVLSVIPRKLGDKAVMSGYRVPKDQIVILNSNILLQENAYVYDASQYIPERWIRTEKTGFDQINPFVYIPFGYGPRSCVGRRVLEMELEALIARIVRNFNIEFNYTMEKAFKNRIVNIPAIPLKFKFTEVGK